MKPSKSISGSVAHRAIPRNGWQPVNFGDVVRNVSETCRDPEAEGLERYLGLEHIDSENLHIKRWGLLAENDVSFTRRFRKGQVLFGKRRAYLKKVAVAEFDGICSSDILCFETKDPKVLLPDLLPFIVQSDGFFAHALGTSSGSLSPRTRWPQLKNYTFPLPPLDEQRRIAQLLWATEGTRQAYVIAIEHGRILRNTLHRDICECGATILKDGSARRLAGKDGWKSTTVGTACRIANTLRKPLSASVRSKMQGPYPYYGPTGQLDSINEYRIDGTYVLLGEDGDHFLKYLDWNMTQLISGKFNVNNHAHILQGQNGVLTEWVYYYFKHKNIKQYLSRQGAGRLKLKKATLVTMPILVPPIDEQRELISLLSSIDDEYHHIIDHCKTTAETLTALREQLLGAPHDL